MQQAETTERVFDETQVRRVARQIEDKRRLRRSIERMLREVDQGITDLEAQLRSLRGEPAARQPVYSIYVDAAATDCDAADLARQRADEEQTPFDDTRPAPVDECPPPAPEASHDGDRFSSEFYGRG